MNILELEKTLDDINFQKASEHFTPNQNGWGVGDFFLQNFLKPFSDRVLSLADQSYREDFSYVPNLYDDILESNLPFFLNSFDLDLLEKSIMKGLLFDDYRPLLLLQAVTRYRAEQIVDEKFAIQRKHFRKH